MGCSLLSIIEIFYFTVKGCLGLKNRGQISIKSANSVKAVQSIFYNNDKSNNDKVQEHIKQLFGSVKKLQEEINALQKNRVRKLRSQDSIETIRIN